MFDNKNQDLAQPYRIILGLNIQCLRYHKDELTVLLETIDHKPDISSLTETWIAEEDSAEEYTLTDYQPIESVPRKNFKRRSGGVDFYVKNPIKYKPIEFTSDIQCNIIEVQFTDTYSTTICAIYRPETLRLNQFFPKLEKLLHFLNSRSTETGNFWRL